MGNHDYYDMQFDVIQNQHKFLKYIYIYKIIFKNGNFNREYLYYSAYYKNKK